MKLKTHNKYFLVIASIAMCAGLAHGATPIYSLGFEHNSPTGGNNATVINTAVIASNSNLTVGAGLGQYFVYGNICHYSGVNQATFADAVANNDYIEYSFTTTVSLPANSSLVETTYGGFSNDYYGTSFAGAAPTGYTFVISTDAAFTSPTTLTSGVTTPLPGVDAFEFKNDATSYAVAANTTYYFRAYLYNSATGNALFDDTGFGIAAPAIPEPSSIVTLSLLAGLAVTRRRR